MPNNELIRLRDLPGVQKVTDLCRNPRLFEYPVNTDTQSRIDEVSIRLFGINAYQTTWAYNDPYRYPAYEDYDDEYDEDDAEDNEGEDSGDDVDHNEPEQEFVDYRALERAWEEKFSVTRLSWPASEPFWTAIGWDISDGAGKELISAHCFDRQIIAAAGQLVEGAQITTDGSGRQARDDQEAEEDLAHRLKSEADAFIARQRRR